MNFLVLGQPYFLPFLNKVNKIFTVGFYDYNNIKLKKAVYKIDYILSLIDWKPDLIFLGDDSFPITYIGLEKVEIPTVWYAVDSHIHPWHLFYANIFDIVLFAQKQFLEVEFKYSYPNIKKWFPLYCNPEVHKKLNLRKEFDLCFVGTLNPKLNKPRVELMNKIKSKLENFYCGEGEFVEIFNKSLIVLNQSANNDINFRTFEAMACGSLLLNERIAGNGFNELFKENYHLICYEKGNVDEIVEKVKFYKKNLDKAREIAENGYKYVIENHSIKNRAEQFRNLIEFLNFPALVEKRIKNIKEINFHLKMAYLCASESYKFYPELSNLYQVLASEL